MTVKRWPYAVSGLVAAITGMAVGHLVAVLATGTSSSPVLAVGSTVVDATPTPVKEWAIRTLGTSDKPFLLAVVAVVTALAAAGIGLFGRSRPNVARLLLVGLAALAGAAAVARPDASTVSPVPSALAALVGLGVLGWLRGHADSVAMPRGSPSSASYEAAPQRAPSVRTASGASVESPTDHTVVSGTIPGRGSRRTFLVGAGALTAGSVVALALQKSAAPSPTTTPARPLPTPTDPATAAPPATLDATVPGITPWRTSTADFYRVDTEFVVPRLDASSWRLVIDGDVDTKVTITYAQLLAMPMIERDITLACVSNEVNGDLTGGARWLGVRTADLLKMAGVKPGVDQILSSSSSGMTISTPLAALTDGRDAMVAIAMNGKPLTNDHGFPARMVTPGLYGYTGATKWLTSMTATTYSAATAYWTERGWVTDAPVLTECRIDVPRGKAKAGRVAIGGVAWAMHRGITGVEVQVDGGAWQKATLGPDSGIDYWRQWYLPWDALPGKHTITARATDATGARQTPAVADPYPSGATGWPSTTVQVN